MKSGFHVLALTLFACAGVANAQQRGAQPPLLACGIQGDVEIICGTRSPEDLELTPDNKFIVVSQFAGGRGNAVGATLSLFDPAARTFTNIPISVEARQGWGEPACTPPAPGSLAPHGISLSKRTDGTTQLYVVNHGGRQSIEMYEPKQVSGAWTLAWHGCMIPEHEYNDVAAMPDGGFLATRPTVNMAQGADVFSGQPTGDVVRWAPGRGESVLPDSQAGYPNGVLASPDGRYAYISAWTAKEVHKYDLRDGKRVDVVKLDFMPDNLSWTSNGKILAAGVKGTRGECPAGSGSPCIQGFGVAEVDPGNMQSRMVFDSAGKGALIGGVSIALQSGDNVYVGSFQGDRMVRIEWRQGRP